jgi:acetyl-CoA carboxylase carboxyltransferase component
MMELDMDRITCTENAVSIGETAACVRIPAIVIKDSGGS